MENETKNSHSTKSCDHCKKCKGRGSSGVSSGAYGLAFIGALVYFIQQADSFGAGLLGLLKAVVWPALVVYNFLGFLGL